MKLKKPFFCFTIILTSLGCVLATPAQAERSFMDTVQIVLGIKEEKSGPGPEDTLVAPFAENDVKPVSPEDYKKNGGSGSINNIPMHLPHISVKDVQEWLSSAVGDSLKLDKAKIDDFDETVKPYFTDQGFQQYQAFGEKTNIFSVVYYNDDTSVMGFISERPVPVSSGAVDEVYQWKFQLPVTLNLIKGQLDEYEETKATQQQKKINLCVTVTRVRDANQEGILINSWSLKKCGIAKGQIQR